MKTKINSLLIFLILLDLVLSTVCLIFPNFWVQTMHGIPAADPLGLIRRLGAVWAAFFLFQFIALFKWEQEPFWLVLVAGIRWTEIFSDWVYLYFADSITWFGTGGLLVSPPINALIGWYLISCYRHLSLKNKG